MPLDCPICFESYDLESRKPKGLHCGHNLCNRCVTNLSDDGDIVCPMCRHPMKTDSVVISYGLVDAVRERLGATSVECPQCNGASDRTHISSTLNVRTPCSVDAKHDFEKLYRAMEVATEKLLDQFTMDDEIRKRKETTKRIKITCETMRKDLDRQEQILQGDVLRTSAANGESYKEWAEYLESHLDRCHSFTEKIKAMLGENLTKACSVDNMCALQTEAKELALKMNKIQTDTPRLTDFRFVTSHCLLQVGELVCQPKTSFDYMRVTPRALTVNRGTGAEQFKDRASVCLTEDNVIAVGYDDHKIKVFDYNLELMFTIGEEGRGKHNLNRPWGICTIGDEFFVSDEINNRIKVYNKNTFGLLRIFGSRGSGDDQFDSPLGLAAGPLEELYVCDALNYRVKVLKPDGRYVRSIKCQRSGLGAFTEVPQRVAVTSNGIVIVIDSSFTNGNLYKNTGEFLRRLVYNVPESPQTPRLTGLALDKDNNVILADCANGRLLVLDKKGEFICSIGSSGSHDGELGGPWDVAISEHGHLVVYETLNHRLQLFQVNQ